MLAMYDVRDKHQYINQETTSTYPLNENKTK